MSRLVASALLLWVAVVGMAQAADRTMRFPTSPVDPTMEDCRAMTQEYYVMVRDLRRQNDACLRGDPKIGPGQECGLISHKVYDQTRAWPQCSSIDVQLCDVYARMETETSSCNARAAKRARRENELDNRRMSDADTRRAAALKYGMDEFDRISGLYHNTKELITDPHEFLLGKLNEKLAAMIFPEGEEASPADRIDLAEQVYRLAFKAADKGVSLQLNPVIRSFQENGLEILKAHAQRLNGQMRSLSAQMDTFTLAQMKPFATLQVRPVDDPECAIFSDPARSESLYATDQLRWERLQERCG